MKLLRKHRFLVLGYKIAVLFLIRGLLINLFPLPALGLEKEVKYQLEFVWNSVEDAKSYQLEFDKQTGEKKKLKYRTKKSKWAGGLTSGIYMMRLRSLDSRGVPGEWSPDNEIAVLPPSPKTVFPRKFINSKEVKSEKVKFSWKPVEGVKKYLLEITSPKKQRQSIEVDKTNAELDLPVGKRYSWQIYSLVDGVKKEKLSAKIKHFTLFGRAPMPEVDEPSSDFVERIEWKESNANDRFFYSFYRKKKGKWKKVFRGRTKKQYAKVPKKLSGGEYKIKVSAKGPLRRKSKSKEMEFFLASERGPAAIKVAKLKEVVERPSRFQVTGSYIITNLDYSAINQESATKNAFSALGGAGRIGLGYTPRRSQWGGMGFAEFSGFSVSGQTFAYFGLEAQTTYKKSFGSKVLKLYSGVFMKQLPETLTSVVDETQLELNKVSFAGPTLAASYAIPFTQKFGVQLNARTYYSLLSLGTPNGEGVSGTLSFQVSALFSYRWSKKITALFGYALKKEAIDYETLSSNESDSSFADEGAINSIDLTGHYLNFALEWGF